MLVFGIFDEFLFLFFLGEVEEVLLSRTDTEGEVKWVQG